MSNYDGYTLTCGQIIKLSMLAEIEKQLPTDLLKHLKSLEPDEYKTFLFFNVFTKKSEEIAKLANKWVAWKTKDILK